MSTPPALAAPPTQHPTTVRFRVMAFLCVLSFLTYFDRNCITRLKPMIMTDLGISDVQMGFIFAAFWFAYAFFEIPGGWLGDRYGARGTLTRIVLAWSLFTALSGSAVGFVSLLTYRFLFGVGEAGAYPNMARVQGAWLPQQARARAGGLLWLLARWGAAFAPIIVGRMIWAFDQPSWREAIENVPVIGSLSQVASWRLVFWTAGIIGAVWCVWFALWFRDDPASKPAVNEAELNLIRAGRTAKEKHAMSGAMWRALFSCRSLWAVGVLYICSSFGFSFFVSWIPVYFEKVHQVKFEQSEIMTGLPLFCGGISCLVGGMLSDYLVRRTQRKWLFRALFPMIGYGSGAAAMLCIPLVNTPEEATLLMCVAMAGGDFGQGANWATIVDIGGRYAGTAAGFINMVGNSGNYLQPPIGALVFEHFGWPVLFGLYATMYLIAASMWLLVNPHRRFYEHLVERDDAMVCPHCGYDLRGSPGAAACPECGAAIAAAQAPRSDQ